MKELKKLSVSVLKEINDLIKSITYKDGKLNTKCQKGLNDEVKSCAICLTLGMIIINILATNKVKDEENIKMLKELHKTIDNAFNRLGF